MDARQTGLNMPESGRRRRVFVGGFLVTGIFITLLLVGVKSRQKFRDDAALLQREAQQQESDDSDLRDFVQRGTALSQRLLQVRPRIVLSKTSASLRTVDTVFQTDSYSI